MTFETFLWSRLKRRVLCRSLHIHIPSQRRTCPAAKGKHWEASQRGIHPKNKKLQPLPLLECQEVCLFCCVLFFNRSFNRWATVTRLVRKVHPTRRSNFSSLRYKEPFLQNKALLLGQFILVIHIQMVPWSSSSMYSFDGSSCPHTEHKPHQ